MKKIFLFTMLALAISVAGSAQLINTKTISLEAAKKIVAESVKYAKANNAPGGAIAVVDAGGNRARVEPRIRPTEWLCIEAVRWPIGLQTLGRARH